ncbi:hypothetical protein H9L01_05400 [Erysipelothrix inopinata]|uniref:KAP NTPase domain-containing protein n=2 Tax=Erysipelothrix inopinata TaxID=225084 RepID=A0A7G9RW54_9FIRM|nr:P-loop NTPase fold protein [Erysipelothrix inopinata]QNN59829.1 hypothetical protein H9L01_05400 [Erysipelothrix inopinata]
MNSDFDNLKNTLSRVEVPIDNVEHDKFRYNKNAEGFAKFLEKCEMPITVSIQGDWGSGKTSFMNLVRNNFLDNNSKEQNEFYKFDAWQFSAFGSEEFLPIFLLEEIAENTGCKSKQATRFFEELKSISILKLVETGSNYGIKIDPSVFDSNHAQKREKLINSINEKTSGRRIVYFIDDLDRVKPEVAIEMLEVIKSVLNLKNFIFVVAIDLEVIRKGLEKNLVII